jgi:hypothetical protein
MAFTLTKNYSDYKNLKDIEMWCACLAVWESGFSYHILEWRHRRRMPLVIQSVDKKIILKLLHIRYGGAII